MDFSDISSPKDLGHTRFVANREGPNDNTAHVGVRKSMKASLAPQLCLDSLSHTAVIPSSPQPPAPCRPSLTVRTTNTQLARRRSARSRLRYGTDSIHVDESPSREYIASERVAQASLGRAAPSDDESAARFQMKGHTHPQNEADASTEGAMSVSPAPLCSPSRTIAVATPQEETSKTIVLLRHSCGNRTRILYSDGHVETKISIHSANFKERHLRAAATVNHGRRGADSQKKAPPKPLLDTVKSGKRFPPPPLSENEPWLIESYNAVAKIYQQPTPPLLELSAPPSARASLFSNRSSHTAEQGILSPIAPLSTPPAESVSTASLVTAQTAPLRMSLKQRKPPSTTEIAISLPTRESMSQASTGHYVDRSEIEGASGPSERDNTSDDGIRGSLRPLEATQSLTFTAAATLASISDDTREKVVALQKRIRTEMAVEHCTRAKAFAERFARDISASPSLFSLRFPFKPLSELYAYADRPSPDHVPTSVSPSSIQSTDLPSESYLGRPRDFSSSSVVGERTSTSVGHAPPWQQIPDVLLPHAQVTSPSGFTVPELLQDRLLPRETPALQLKMKELITTRGLLEADDSPVCRLTVSFVWYVILRCRKAHREQSLVDDFRRLSRALSNAFPHVVLGEALPPLDVLQQLLVELITCSRYSTDIEKTLYAADVTANAASSDSPGVEARKSGKQDNGGTTLPKISVTQTPQQLPHPENVNLTTSLLPLHLPLQEHSAYFPLLLSPAWSKLVQTGPLHLAGRGRRRESMLRHAEGRTPHPQLDHLQQKQRGGLLPAANDLDILRGVYHDLWLHYSEYVQLSLYEELLYKQLGRQFALFVVHLHRGHTATEASSASAVLNPAGSTLTSTTNDAMGGGPRTSPRDTHTSSSLTFTAAASNTVAGASAASPEVIDSVLNSTLLLMAHATYYNCVFCFPNDFFAGMFDEEFRSDVMRWIFFCCHGVVLTHVHVRHWPVPIKGDHADAQHKRREAIKRELESLGLLPPDEQHPVDPCHDAAIPTETAKPSLSVSFSTIAESGGLDLGALAENSEARLAYELDKYGRSVAGRMTELKRCMARLQKRHVVTGFPTLDGTGPLPRGGNASATLYQVSPPSSTTSSTVVSTQHPSCSSDRMKAAKLSARQEKPHASVSVQSILATDAETSAIPRSSMAKEGSLPHPPLLHAPKRSSQQGSQLGLSTLNGPGGRPTPSRPRGLSAGGTGAAAYHDRQEGARAQYRTSAAAATGINLVKLVAEVRGGGDKGGARGVAASTPGREGIGEVASSAGAVQSGTVPSSAGGGADPHTADVDAPHDHEEEGAVPVEQKRQGTRSLQVRCSLLSSYPLCVCPALIRDYWLVMLLRASLWWTTRTATATATAIAGAEVAKRNYEVQQLSVQLVLWPFMPVGVDGKALPRQDVCRLQMEPWRGLFTAVIAVPPISKEAQQAVHQIEICGRLLRQQQAHLYRIIELQNHLQQQSQQPFSPGHSEERLALALALLKPTVNLDMSLSEPTVGIDPLQMRSIGSIGRGSGNAVSFTDLACGSPALLPAIAPENMAALSASGATPKLVATSTSPISNQRRNVIGDTYQGSTSPFSMMYSSYFMASSSPPPNFPVQNQAHRIGAVGSNSQSESVEGAMPDSTLILPSLARSPPNLSLEQGIATNSTTASGEAKTRSGVKRSNVRKTRGMKRHFPNTFSITSFSDEETKLCPHRVGPLLREATSRHAQLLTEMGMIEKRDQIARQNYVTQHLKLSNAVAYTQSEAMTRRYRTHSRLALERLQCSDLPDTASVRGTAECVKDFKP